MKKICTLSYNIYTANRIMCEGFQCKKSLPWGWRSVFSTTSDQWGCWFKLHEQEDALQITVFSCEWTLPNNAKTCYLRLFSLKCSITHPRINDLQLNILYKTSVHQRSRRLRGPRCQGKEWSPSLLLKILRIGANDLYLNQELTTFPNNLRSVKQKKIKGWGPELYCILGKSSIFGNKQKNWHTRN